SRLRSTQSSTGNSNRQSAPERKCAGTSFSASLSESRLVGRTPRSARVPLDPLLVLRPFLSELKRFVVTDLAIAHFYTKLFILCELGGLASDLVFTVTARKNTPNRFITE